MKIKSFHTTLLTGSLVLFVGIFSIIFWHRANSASYKVYSAVETVEMFFQLNEKSDTVAMREFVTNQPPIFLDQMVARARRNATLNAEKVKEIEKKLKINSNITQEPSVGEAYPKAPYYSKIEIVNELTKWFVFKDKTYLKQITEVVQNENEARISVDFGSRTKNEYTIPTKFWLYKENDGKWRIFLIQNMVMNEEFAN